ncbi:unnamed protein product [Closterium sp. NIES-54]
MQAHVQHSACLRQPFQVFDEQHDSRVRQKLQSEDTCNPHSYFLTRWASFSRLSPDVVLELTLWSRNPDVTVISEFDMASYS